MGALHYAVHAYAWTTSWSDATLGLIDHARDLGFDLIEIPLMELEQVHPERIKERLLSTGLSVCTSTACSEAADITAEDPATRERGIRYLEACVRATATMGGSSFSGVIYSAIGRRIDGIPGEQYWQRAADGLRRVARTAAELGVTISIEPINRYETFLVNTCEQALRLRSMINEPNVGIHLDAYHMNIEEDEFYAPTKKAVPALRHFHLSESHRGIPGRGTVDWEGIYRALAEGGYRGVVGLESFIEVSPAMQAATCIWRHLAPSSDALLTEGLRFLKGLEAKYYRGS